MSVLTYLLAGLFLPLFPLSMGFNTLFARVRHPAVRGLLLLVWPQVGLGLVATAGPGIPSWIVPGALLTSALYAYRALALREVGLWIGFLATSAWAPLWIATAAGTEGLRLHVYALAFSAPLVLLALLAAGLERRFGAAYTGLYGGLAQVVPRFSGVLVLVVLAVVATPLFPSFFAMLFIVLEAAPAAALALVVIWLLWSWAGARLIQGLVVGPAKMDDARDLSRAASWAYAAVLGVLLVGGLSLAGGTA